MFPIYPPVIPGHELGLQAGRDYTCPYCHVQSVQDEADTGWAFCPMRPDSSKWICLGCLDEIYATCISNDYMNHACRDLVKSAAKKDGLDENSYRLLCLKNQLETLVKSGRAPNPHIPSREYLEKLIAELGKKGKKGT